MPGCSVRGVSVLLRLRAIARWALYFSVVSFFLQGLLLATSFYDTWFATLLRLF